MRDPSLVSRHQHHSICKLLRIRATQVPQRRQSTWGLPPLPFFVPSYITRRDEPTWRGSRAQPSDEMVSYLRYATSMTMMPRFSAFVWPTSLEVPPATTISPPDSLRISANVSHIRPFTVRITLSNSSATQLHQR
ncbi:uncharacterized protein B0I36DRAFT_68407 [Microdochium trichocladiopsis]|uniref:Uncharacterized protein n=1 Tax=Microdochium trichocladiopsis TaxID=1682393 RepID=A0A9P8YEM3_9PEZI|nr:uncharacterized protein B0I36DRAFT_68407 [Microdochium trichocladiopsis]KAH7037596.1 hypothetical protein B0I36DRAFT_68407 [Microdochium trichocladiopsis]